MKTRKLIGAFSIAAMAALALTGCSITVSEDTADDTTSDTTTDTDTDTGTSTGDNGTTTGGSTDSESTSGDSGSTTGGSTDSESTSGDSGSTTGGSTDSGSTSGDSSSTSGGSTSGGSTSGGSSSGGSSSGGSSSGDSSSTSDNTYTVIFNTNGGSYVSSVTVTKNGTLSTLPTTSKDGYTFDGWYSNAACTELFTSTTVVGEDITLYAKWTAIQTGDIISTAYGYAEGLYAIFTEPDATSSAIKVEVKKSGDSTYTTVDDELVRTQTAGSTARVDVVGLTEGTYDLKITNSEGISQTKASIAVSSYDRSGYAHFSTSNDGTGVNVSEGIGAYKNDGTLKDNAVVVYVTDDTKNSVKATIGGTEYTGLANILQAQQYSSHPLVVRILGEIQTTQWDYIDTKTVYGTGSSSERLATQIELFDSVDGWNSNKLTESYIKAASLNDMSDDENAGITQLSGLTTQMSRKLSSGTTAEYDSYFNMLDVKNAKNLTLEGIGSDSVISQWGLTFKLCSSVEVRNITFSDYTEDACAFEGAEDSFSIAGFTTGHNWVHNSTFNIGKNNWDVSLENDKKEGDGSTDLKKLAFATLSYVRYNGCHKTGLVGGSDSQTTASVTFHHNYYNGCQSRLPFARQANMHMYNNYYSGSTGNNMQIYAGAYAFIEASYFENAKNTFKVANAVYKVLSGSTAQEGVTYYSDSKATTVVEVPVGTVFTSSKYNGAYVYQKNQPAVKSYNNIFTGISSTSGATVVTDRTTTVENGNIYNQNFDTDTTDFYYDAENHVSDVEYLTSAEQAKDDCVNYAGAGTMYNVAGSTSTDTTTDTSTSTSTDTSTSTSTDISTSTTTDTSTSTSTSTSTNLTTYSLDCSTVTSISNLGDDYTVVDSAGDTISLSNGAIKLGSNGSNSDKYIGITVSGTGTVTVEVTAYINTSAAKPYAYLAVQKDSEDATSWSIISGDAITYTYTFTVSGTSTFYIYRSSGSGTGVLVTSIVTTYTAS